jgi:hypothetical protein
MSKEVLSTGHIDQNRQSGYTLRVISHRRRTILLSARLGLLLFAWALLLFRLDEVPPGFQHDQTFTVLDALQVLQGHFSIYFPANFGREPLFMYSAAAVIRAIGEHFVWSLRFTGVLWGMAGLAATLALARRYLPEAGALVAGALLAASFWFLMATRLGLEPIALLVLAIVYLYLLDRGLERPSLRMLAAAGFAGGAAVYTYLAARTLFLVIPVLLLYEGVVWIRQGRSPGGRRPEQTARLTGLLLALALMLVVSAPLLIYLGAHPAAADARVRELGGPVSAALRGDLRPLLANALDTIRSIVWTGSRLLPYQYNIPGRAALQPILAVFFLVGLIATLLRVRERREILLLAALLLGIGPSLVTGADALYMRAIYALPLLYILAARGLWTAGSLAGRAFSRAPASAPAGGPVGSRGALTVAAGVLLAGLLLWHTAESGAAYFLHWANAEQTQRIYNADFRAAARYLNEQPASGEVFIGTDRLIDLDSRTYDLYLADLDAKAEQRRPRRADVNWFSLPESPALPTDGHDALYLMPSNADAPPSLQLLAPHGGEQFQIPAPGGQQPLLRGYRLSGEAVQRALDEMGVRPAAERVTFGDALRLDALGLRDEGAGGELITRWTVLGPWPRSARPGYPFPGPKLALSLLDDTGYKWTQADVPTSLPAQTWRQGQTLVERIPFSIPADLPPGEYEVRLAMYDDEGGPLSMRNDAGAEVGTPPIAGTLQIEARPRGDAPVPPYPVRETRAGADLRPLGSWESPEKLEAGVPADLHVSWQALQPLETAGLRFWLRATADDGTVVWEQPADPVAPLPEHWPAAQVYRLTHRLLPDTPRTAPVSATIEICAGRSDADAACAQVGHPQILSRAPVFELPAPPEQPSGARWDETLSLAGYDLASSGQAITLTLYWRTDAPAQAPLKRFVHAADAVGRIVTQSDAPLESEGIPPAYWRPGEYVVDRVELSVPAGAEVNELRLGLYDAQTEERLLAYAPSGDPLPDRQLTIRMPEH